MTDDHITELQVGVLETKDNGVPVFAATDGDRYWKDAHPTCGVDAAFYGEDRYDNAIELADEPDVDWYDIEIMEGFHARYSDDSGYGMLGDTPGEAVSYLSFDEDEAFPAVTEAATLEAQVEDILTARTGSIHELTMIHWVVNDDALDTNPTLEDVENALDRLVEEAESPIARAERGEYHARP